MLQAHGWLGRLMIAFMGCVRLEEAIFLGRFHFPEHKHFARSRNHNYQSQVAEFRATVGGNRYISSGTLAEMLRLYGVIILSYVISYACFNVYNENSAAPNSHIVRRFSAHTIPF